VTDVKRFDTFGDAPFVRLCRALTRQSMRHCGASDGSAWTTGS
jgi:hypothetical protein